ncbi:branched-chain amino acid ABC transporter permease LivH [Sinorhizobium medicae]|uniref:branched-chain amino acid ABC transporter permease n=1 Tax=Sinorhizobium medicae TaxID=110321 RepID=UPI000C7C2D10|nr:branched-chain amino acid ABC transporter permease [Sinorhizobium medicae]PLU76485.1 branched-chain amino acid ABC transporter permease LivH [Sinorhizobium medicae]
MEYFIQQLVNGLTLGSIYGMIAIGYTMVYGIIGMINFAHGDIFMLGGFAALIVFLILTTFIGGVPVVLALLIMMIVGMLTAALWNWTIERVAYRPLRGSFRLAPLITAIGMSIVLSNFIQVTQGPRNKPIPPLVSSVYEIFGITVSLKQIVIVVITAILLSVFWYIVNRTPLGRAQRATEQDRKMAALLGVDVDRTISVTFIMGAALAAVAGGVDVDRTISVTFIMGAALAAVAGTMYLMYYGVVVFTDGFAPGVKAFTAAVLGGIGSLPGAVLGGLLIGLIESLWSAYFTIDYKDVATFSILAIVLIFKPSGILGRPEVEKV